MRIIVHDDIKYVHKKFRAALVPPTIVLIISVACIVSSGVSKVFGINFNIEDDLLEFSLIYVPSYVALVVMFIICKKITLYFLKGRSR